MMLVIIGAVVAGAALVFVDDAKAVIGEVDDLCNEMMTAEGYAMADFYRRAALRRTADGYAQLLGSEPIVKS